MGILPTRLPILNKNMEPIGESWAIIDPSSDQGRKLTEKDIDTFMEKQVDVIAEALLNAGILEDGSALRFLGRGIDHVDVLYAEAPKLDGPGAEKGGRWGELKRLVIVEDKLVRNTQQKRQVIAQILEYAQRAEVEWLGGQLANKVKAKAKKAGDDIVQWLEKNNDRIDYQLRRGEYLLVIAGDQITASLDRLARRFSAQDNPLHLSELCLLTISRYRHGDQILLVPHVVSSVTRSKRELTIQVKVKVDGQNNHQAEVKREQPDTAVTNRGSEKRADITQFLKNVRKRMNNTPIVERLDLWSTERPSVKLDLYTGNDEDAWVSCVVHFGGYSTRLSPIQVGISCEKHTTESRDDWYSFLEVKLKSKKLPKGTKLSKSVKGGQVSAFKLIEWDVSKEPSAKLQDQVVDLMTRYLEAISDKVTEWAG